MGYFRRENGSFGISPFLNGVQEVESSNLFAPTRRREFEHLSVAVTGGFGPPQ
jgi:hypothetical protein